MNYADLFLTITNNGTFSGLLVLLFASGFAIPVYKKQKEIDRLDGQRWDTVKLLSTLQQRIDQISLFVDQISGSYKTLQITVKDDNSNAEEIEKTFTEALKQQIPKISTILFDEIPVLDKQIVNALNYIFPNSVIISEKHGKLKESLKKWHEFFAGYGYSKYLDQSSEELEKLNKKSDLLSSVTELILTVQKEKMKSR